MIQKVYMWQQLSSIYTVTDILVQAFVLLKKLQDIFTTENRHFSVETCIMTAPLEITDKPTNKAIFIFEQPYQYITYYKLN